MRDHKEFARNTAPSEKEMSTYLYIYVYTVPTYMYGICRNCTVGLNNDLVKKKKEWITIFNFNERTLEQNRSLKTQLIVWSAIGHTYMVIIMIQYCNQVDS